MKYQVFVACKMKDNGIKMLKNQEDFSVVVNPKPTQEELLKTLATAHAIIIRSNVKLPAKVLEKANNLKIICRGGAGVDNIDIKKATEKGISVCNTPGLNSNSVAEQVFTYIHTLYKNIRAYDNSTKAGAWEKGKYPINELRGKTLGIGGLGAIGRRVLEKARGYSMGVRVYDPFLSNTMAGDLGCEIVPDLNQLFKTCDIVTLHMPATAETKGKITAKLLGSMKKNAIFINTARGALLAPNALEDALKSNPTLKAGVDVYSEEGAGKKELARYGDRVVMTPHISGNSMEGQGNIANLLSSLIIDALTKDKLRNLVNFVSIPEELNPIYMDLAEDLGKTAASFSRNGGQLEEIRITCYGKLDPYWEILVKSAIKGVLAIRNPLEVTLINAEAKAKEQGIKITRREPDNTKQYGESITVDVVVREKKKTKETSIRGKLVESEPAIVRINDYGDLSLEPAGNQLFVIYGDKPGVIGCIASLMGEMGINIESMTARHESGKNKKHLLIIRTSETLPATLKECITRRVESSLKTKVYSVSNISF